MDSYHKAINMSDYDDLPPSYDEVMKNTDNSKLYLNPLANPIMTLDNVTHLTDQLDSQLDGQLDSRSANQSNDQLSDQLDHAERGGQSASSCPETNSNHSNHLEEVSAGFNHSSNSNDPASSNACEMNKAAGNNVACRPNDSGASRESVNNDPNNNNQSLPVR